RKHAGGQRRRIRRRVKSDRELRNDSRIVEIQNADEAGAGAKLEYVAAFDPGHVVDQIVVPRRTTLLQEVLNRVRDQRKRQTIAFAEVFVIEEQRGAGREAKARFVRHVGRQARNPGDGPTWARRFLTATRESRKLLADIVQLHVVRQFRKEV